jgi:UDP-N-acetylglucosamine 2-epimerase (non-hydrolysing)
VPRLDLIVGARPNFMKAAPLVEELRARFPWWDVQLVHTGQHYDRAMSELLFEQLGIPEPDVNLGVGSGSQAEQTAKLLVALEQRFTERRPDLVVVFGDVNSTLAAALVASKMLIPVAHVEAGLRSFDRTMPEEINRLVTDALSELLFTTEPSGNANLEREGVAAEKVHFVGNLMIDTLMKHRRAAAALHVASHYGLQPKSYAVLTLHRPGNVDNVSTFNRLFGCIAELAREHPIVFPVHPRTRARITESQLAVADTQLRLIEPMGYLEFLGLMQDAAVLLTDSGGIQEEAVILGIPCITLRHNTERPATLAGDANMLVGDDVDRMARLARAAFGGEWTVPQTRPEKWDGRAAQRLAGVIEWWFSSRSRT